jgi:TetR/AcrR family transcriptional repressor of nem operon
MRVSREKAAENRERIIDAAGALFRAKGFGGIGVADIMKAADLTHGGFYGHFASKDDLVAQASRRTMARAAANWEGSQPARPISLTQLCCAITSRRAIGTNPDRGCAFAALSADAARSGKACAKPSRRAWSP